MPSPAPSQKSPSRSQARRPLSGMVPIKLLSLNAVFEEFVSIGKVLPDEKGRFCEYVADLSQFVSKDALRMMTSRLPPFTQGEVGALESDAVKLENSLNSYLKYTAKSGFHSKTWYERYKTKIKLAVELRLPPEKKQHEEGGEAPFQKQ